LLFRIRLLFSIRLFCIFVRNRAFTIDNFTVNSSDLLVLLCLDFGNFFDTNICSTTFASGQLSLCNSFFTLETEYDVSFRDRNADNADIDFSY